MGVVRKKMFYVYFIFVHFSFSRNAFPDVDLAHAHQFEGLCLHGKNVFEKLVNLIRGTVI